MASPLVQTAKTLLEPPSPLSPLSPDRKLEAVGRAAERSASPSRSFSPSRSSKQSVASRGSAGTNPLDGLSAVRVYCKAVPGDDGCGRRVVACPHFQEARLVLGMKKLDYVVQPVLEKPEWLQGGSLPAVAGPEGEDPVELSDMAAMQIDAAFPKPRIDGVATSHGLLGGKWPAAASQRLCQAISRFLKNMDPAAHSDLEAGLMAQIELLDGYLLEGRQPFLAGPHAGLPDAQVAPMLKALQVAGGRMKKFVLAPRRRHLHAYMRRVFSLPLFVETGYDDDAVVAAWTNEQRRRTRRLSYQQLLRVD